MSRTSCLTILDVEIRVNLPRKPAHQMVSFKSMRSKKTVPVYNVFSNSLSQKLGCTGAMSKTSLINTKMVLHKVVEDNSWTWLPYMLAHKSKNFSQFLVLKSRGLTYMRVGQFAYEEKDLWLTDGPVAAAVCCLHNSEYSLRTALYKLQIKLNCFIFQ